MSEKTSARSEAKYDNSNEEDFEDNEGDKPPPKNCATAEKATLSKVCPGPSNNDSDIELMGATKSQAPLNPASSSIQMACTTAKKPKYNYGHDSETEKNDDSNIKEITWPTAHGKKPIASTWTAKARLPSQTQSTMTSFASRWKSSASLHGISRNAKYLESDSDDEPSRGGGGWGSASQRTNGQSRR